MSEFAQQAEALIDDAVLGKQVQEFWSSDVGQYVLGEIEREYEQGIAELKAAPAHEAQAIQSAQNKVHRAESIKAWLHGAIARGLQATNVLEFRQDQDEDGQ